MTDKAQSLGDFTLTRRKVLLGLGMVAASGTAMARMPEPNTAPIDTDLFNSLIPNEVGPWRFASRSGVVLPPSDALSDRLYDNLATRVYLDGKGGAIMFLAAYNNRQDGILQIHRPEICYPAGGFVLSETREVDVPLSNGSTLPASAFLATGNDRDETVLYWTRVGDDFPRQWALQRLSVIRANMRGIVPDGLLIRISTLGRDVAEEVGILSSFMSEFVDAAPAALKPILFGANKA
jgi:EpsI family protein